MVENLVSKRDPKFSSLKIWFSSTVQRLSTFFNMFPISEKSEKIFYNGFPISSTAVRFLQRLSAFFNGFPIFLNGFPFSEKSRKIYLWRQQSKMKANDFVMGVANKKRRLRSSQQLPWSLRMGWQVVSTAIFEWLLNLWLKMWTYYRVLAVDNLLIRRTNRISKRLASLALGS